MILICRLKFGIYYTSDICCIININIESLDNLNESVWLMNSSDIFNCLRVHNIISSKTSKYIFIVLTKKNDSIEYEVSILNNKIHCFFITFKEFERICEEKKESLCHDCICSYCIKFRV